MENGPFIVDFPIKTSIYKGFSMAMLNNQMVKHTKLYNPSRNLLKPGSIAINWVANLPTDQSFPVDPIDSP
jgi:hypothetical protein